HETGPANPTEPQLGWRQSARISADCPPECRPGSTSYGVPEIEGMAEYSPEGPPGGSGRSFPANAEAHQRQLFFQGGDGRSDHLTIARLPLTSLSRDERQEG